MHNFCIQNFTLITHLRSPSAETSICKLDQLLTLSYTHPGMIIGSWKIWREHRTCSMLVYAKVYVDPCIISHLHGENCKFDQIWNFVASCILLLSSISLNLASESELVVCFSLPDVTLIGTSRHPAGETAELS